MPLLPTTHVTTIEQFLGRDPNLDAAIRLTVVANELHIDPLLTLDPLAWWLVEPVPPSADAVGIMLPVEQRGHLGAIVDRAGSATWFVVEDARVSFEAPASCQLLDDLVRRRLHQPTAPPVGGTDWYWLGRWLGDLHLASVGSAFEGRPRTLDAVAAAGWHPAVDPDDLFGLGFDSLTSLVIENHRDHAAVSDWECVRLDALGDPEHRFHRISPLLDEGSFSRWVVASSRPLSALAEPLMVRCSPFALRLLGAVVSDVVLRQRFVGST